ncbi:MAG: hypothetical protein C0432_00795 [Candidatus Puniceispirillum sp.]|nr:hypothetical protein [Candidatus Pelagibacter sp.]MBA4282819.1 hypothetical protein [Candidatus Puniceispirillum sp.]
MTNEYPSNLFQLRFNVPHCLTAEMVQYVENIDHPSIQSICFFENENSPSLEITDDNGFPISSIFFVDIYVNDQKQALKIQTQINEFLKPLCQNNEELDKISSNLVEVDNTNWLEKCYIEMPAQTIGKFYVFGSHIEGEAPQDSIPLEINAATAFGSGDHQSTSGCLALISKVIESNIQPEKILDMGCGSGILGIACKKAWPDGKVVMADIEHESVKVSTNNAIQNKVDVEVFHSEGFSSSDQLDHIYNLIIANILAKPLCELAKDFEQRLSKDGTIILSGLLTRQKEEVLKHYNSQNLILVDEVIINDWSSLMLKRK